MKKMDERKKKLQKNEKMKMQIKKVRKKTKIKYRKIEKEKVKQKLNKTSKEWNFKKNHILTLGHHYYGTLNFAIRFLISEVTMRSL